MSEMVLVTGAFGLVGSETVKRLADDGRRVVATDLDTPANRKAATALPAGVDVRWADLTDSGQVDRLLSAVSPTAVIHLAAIIPPPIYRNAGLARRVNVDATATLVRAAEAQPDPPRFVQASSNGVHGARNPHRFADIIRVSTTPTPTELYGRHKLEAEEIVRSSSLQWVVLRLGGVMSVDRKAMGLSLDSLYVESALPVDGRVHMVDVRDVAWALAAATTADVVGEILFIGGDDTHRLRQGDVGSSIAAASGLVGGLPGGRPGDPDNDDAWFITDWMDSAPAQQALGFQHHTWPDVLAEMRANAGWTYYPVRLIAPLVRVVLKRRAAYRNMPGTCADPWAAFRSKLGEPDPK